MRPEVSVIVPTYGRKDLVRRAVDSVMSQTWKDFEVIVVDDAGPATVDLPDDKRLHVVRRQQRGGTAAARNTGLALAEGRFVTFLDDDDCYLAERLSRGLEGMDHADVSVCWALAPSPWRGRLEGSVGDRILNDRVPPIGTCTVVAEKIPRFDERFTSSEDVDWWLRLAQNSTFRTVPHDLYLVGRDAEDRKTGHTADRLKCRLMLVEKHREYFIAHPEAEAQQWKRIGGMALTVGDVRSARVAFWRSFKTRPRFKTAYHLARAVSRRQ